MLKTACALLSIAVLLCARPAFAQQPSPSLKTADLLDEMNHMSADELPKLRARAEMGDARAQMVLGLAYETGSLGLTAHQADALSWFLKAAAQGVAWAEGWAADFYFAGGPAVPRDLDKALAMYKSAATHGDTRAAFAAGQMYFYGDGVATSHVEAASWFRRALPEDPALVQRMVDLAEAPCQTSFCVALRQVMGAVMTGSAERYVDGWDEMHREWDAAVKITESDRCGLTSSDKTMSGEVQNYFCDSAPVADDAHGIAMEKELADRVEKALPAGFMRNDRPDFRSGPATFFANDGHAHVRVSYNTTPGSASKRVTLLVGP